MNSKIDAAPKPSFLRSQRNRNIGWTSALAEMIDNAFDANAQQVTISTKNRMLVVHDDGHGIKDLASVVTLGSHEAGKYTSLGMFGVGLKNAWHWIGTKMFVDTIHAGTRGTIEADTAEMERLQSWLIDPPHFEPADKPSETTISIKLHDKDPARRPPTEKNMEDLAWVFTPALRDGRQILHSGGRARAWKALKACEMPTFTKSVDVEFDVSGKHVRLTAGILPEGVRMRNGPLWVQYGHRNILKTAMGCKAYSTERFGGVVYLGKGWSLSDHKDDLTDFKDELEDAIHERIQHLLAEAEKLATDLYNENIQHELNAMLNSALTSAQQREKERRPNGGSEVGTVIATGTKSQRRRAKVHDAKELGSVEVNGGTTAAKSRARGIYLVFQPLDDTNTIGEFDRHGKRVLLNSDNPFVNTCRGNNDLAALYAIAFSVFSHYVSTHGPDGEQLLPFASEGFYRVMGALVRGITGEAKETT